MPTFDFYRQSESVKKSAGRLHKRLAAPLAEGIFATVPSLALAQVQLPGVNLGQTNFEDGFSSPGWFFQEFPTYYDANKLKDSQGNTASGANHLSIFSTTTHIAYLSELPVIGGQLGFEVLQPWVDSMPYPMALPPRPTGSPT